MLGKAHKLNAGFTIIELAVVVAVLGILVTIAVPSFQAMIINSQVRNAAESIANGLQKARGEAVARNRNVEFVLGADSSWVVRLAGGADIETRLASEGSRDVTRTAVASDFTTAATTVTFNGLGGVVANAGSPAPPTLVRVNLTAPGTNRPLRVTIEAGGNAKMCDPGLATGSSPRAC
jgi:type IV fimbrial biogenesis protein FimT